jgi:hypothetical protein
VRIRTHLTVLAAAVVLAACASDADPAAESAPDDQIEQEGSLEELPFEEGEQPDPGELLAELGIEVNGDVASGAGVLLPIPAGWELEPSAAAQGTLLAIADPVDPQALLLGVAGIEDDPASGFEGLDLDGALEVVRQALPDEPERDEAVDLSGAARAHLLVYPVVAGDPEMGAPPAYQVLILAEDAEGTLALFNYVAADGSQDESIVDLLLADAGFDPDSDPIEPPPAPELDDLGELDGDLDQPDQ